MKVASLSSWSRSKLAAVIVLCIVLLTIVENLSRLAQRKYARCMSTNVGVGVGIGGDVHVVASTKTSSAKSSSSSSSSDSSRLTRTQGLASSSTSFSGAGATDTAAAQAKAKAKAAAVIKPAVKPVIFRRRSKLPPGPEPGSRLLNDSLIESTFAAGVDCRAVGSTPKTRDGKVMARVLSSWRDANLPASLRLKEKPKKKNRKKKKRTGGNDAGDDDGGTDFDQHNAAASAALDSAVARHFYRNNKRKVFFSDNDLARWNAEAYYPQRENSLPYPVTRDQVGIVVFTGGNFVHNRAKAVYDVWLHLFKHGRMYTRYNSTDPPITNIPELHPDDNTRNSHWEKALGGLRHLYRTSPDVQWFFVCGCDTYVQPDNFVRALSNFDPTEPWYLGECTGRAIRGTGTEYAMGGPGYAVSRAAVTLLLPHIEELLKRKNMFAYRHVNDIMFGREMLKQGVLCTHVDGFYGSWPEKYGSGHYNLKHWYPLQPQPLAFHYIKKRPVMARLHHELYFRAKFEYFMSVRDYDRAHATQLAWMKSPACLEYPKV